MLHEIQPGDVVYVTLPVKHIDAIIEPHQRLCDRFTGAHIHSFMGTETSVHVIRAKKAENPKPDWPAWRDVKVEKPPRETPVLLSANGFLFVGRLLDGSFVDSEENTMPNIAHWMPLPEGPK